jgi:hypothetical protein
MFQMMLLETTNNFMELQHRKDREYFGKDQLTLTMHYVRFILIYLSQDDSGLVE